MSYLIFKDQKAFMGYFKQNPGPATARLYETLVGEEYVELAAALQEYNGDPTDERLAEVAKEALDCIYVLSGLLHAHGLDPQVLWDVVHQSNIDKIKHPCEACDGTGMTKDEAGDFTMCKACNGQGHKYEVRRREDGKVQKPAGWKKPDLTPMVTEMLNRSIQVESDV